MKIKHKRKIEKGLTYKGTRVNGEVLYRIGILLYCYKIFLTLDIRKDYLIIVYNYIGSIISKKGRYFSFKRCSIGSVDNKYILEIDLSTDPCAIHVRRFIYTVFTHETKT